MEIIVLAHNIRSVLNLGSILRTAEGFGVKKVYLSGYTPNWHEGLPHVREKMLKQIHKTALGAETMVPSEYVSDLDAKISELKSAGWRVLGLEQDPRSILLPNLRKGSTLTQKSKVAILLGEEVNGIEEQLRDLCDDLIEIPMHGRKESFNVAVATGIALYALTTL